MLPRKFLVEIILGLLVILLCVNRSIVQAADTHSCYHCENEDCEDPVTAECKTVQDKCFTRLDAANNNVVQLGCVSQFGGEHDLQESVKNKTLYVCDGDNCNGFNMLPNSNICTQCSSRSEEACATRPHTLTKQQSCNTIPYTQCYQRVKGEVTERGCLYDLEGDEFYNCLTGDDDKCNVCEGKNCNAGIIPSDRKTCHRCSSLTDSNCETSPSALSVCPSYNDTDMCVAVYENGVTNRGCRSEFSCDYKSRNCQICSVDGCNTANIKRRFDDIYGVFQDLPLNCNTCKGDECGTGRPRNTQKCEGDAYQDCMTVFNASGEVIRRGCEFSVLAEQGSHCDLYPNFCFRCKSNGCNDMTDMSIYQECLYCDATTNPDCLFNSSAITTTRNCTLGCVASLYPRKSSPKVLDFVRTCFEDIESDNRDSCREKNNCIKCVGSKCNTAILPTEGRLSCLHCDGSDCDTPTSKHCVGYNPNDMCYMYFDNTTLSAVRMGCRSAIPDDILRAEIKQYFVCDGDDCNDFRNLPQALFCAACDSESDVNCAVAAESVKTRVRCGQLPYTQCFTRIRDDGHTERGCLSDLPTDIFISCHDGLPSSKCKICTENNCNVIYYPYNRQWCHRCNSTTDANCENHPSANQPCPLYQEDDGCITKWINETTIRACASELSCDGLSYKNCRRCSYRGCNSVSLANEEIGDVGLFTDLPLRCHQCNSTAECRNITDVASICSGNINQSCTTVFNRVNEVVARGCSDALEKACSGEDAICFSCKSNGCNVADNKNDYIDCIHCDAKNSDNCTFNVSYVERTRKCYKSCMTALYPRTKDDHPVYELIRTCLDDKNLDDRAKCESSDDPMCKSCTGYKCNTDILGFRKSCYQCKGYNCQSPRAQTCRSVMDKDQCFQKYDERGLLVEMGCRSQYNSSEVDFLVKKKYLWLCDGDNCNHIDNAPKSQTCIICNSKSNAKCAVEPNAFQVSTTCTKTPYTQCYSRVLQNGHTERGCLSNLDDEEFLDCLNNKNSTKCLACIGNKCNQELYPKGRRSCIQCDSAVFPACEDNANEFSGVCVLYAENESCVTKLEGDRTIRGCSSEITCDKYNSGTCRICNKTDNCNTVNLLPSFVGEPGKWQDLPLSCYHCEGEECNSENITLSKCQGNNLQTCMTVFSADGIVVQRGCSDAVIITSSEYCEKNTDKCLACKSNACNNAQMLDEYINCYFCDSLENRSCVIDFDTSKSKTRKCQKSCMVALYPRSSKNDSSYELTRSCLDDLESDDRDKCSKGKMELCKACDSAHCNNMNIPDEPFQCYTCVDVDCEDTKPQQCASYHPNDQCYVLFNNESSIVAMGCRSEFEMDVVNELVRQKKLLLCNGKKCNTPENLPTPKQCSVCNSAENPLCATNPNLVGNITRCATLPFTECFTRVNSYGHTERGCLGSLEEDDFYNCVMNTNGLCETCVGDKCNEIDIYPKNRRRCQQCNSSTDPKCASIPNSNKVCELYREDDQCITNYSNGVTVRGCTSNTKCDNAKDPRTCRICEGDGCNIINMRAVNENGFPGMWQDPPITCYTCKGEEDCENKGRFYPCSNNPLQNCMTVFNSMTGKVSQRGCSDLVERDNQIYCDRNPDKCLRCNSNGCNEASSLDQYVECAYCASEDNGNCTLNVAEVAATRKCYKYCMTALYPRFTEENPSFGLSRSCFDDMDLDDRELCAAGNRKYCKTCNTPKCNVIDMPEKRHSCYICKGTECQSPKVQKCETYRPDDKCYTRFDEKNEVIALGCRSQFSNVGADYLLKEKRLLLCDEENCNSLDNIPDYQTCVLCNSRTDKNCSVSPADVKGITRCSFKPFTSCYSRVLADGATERGCLSDLYDDEFLGCLNGTSTTCQSCKGNKCNTDFFPTSRLKCHVCDSTVYPECEANPNSLSVCYKYDSKDTCVTAFRNNVTYRDCSSSLACDVTDPLTCKKCSGDGCNTINLARKQDDNFGMWQDLPLTCLSCTDNACNLESTTKTLTCELNNKQDCMTVFNASGKVIARGCSDSVEDEFCIENEENCYKCKSNNCNRASSKDDFEECIYCNSHKNQDCVWNPSSSAHKTRKCQGGCMTALFPSHDSDNPSYALIRTCLNDKELSDRKTCANGNDSNCSACSGNKCNTNNVPDKRLSCYICEGESCEQPETKICPLYTENDQCFAKFDDTNSVSEMGCVSSFHNQDLESIIKSKRVYVCWGTNCNSLDQLPHAESCAACNSTEDPSCAVSPNQISTFKTCSMLPYRSCYTKLTASGTTERGCLTDLPADDFAACVLGNDQCGICNENGCNREIFPWYRQQCFTCTSSEESDCDSFPTTKQPCPTVSDTESCITALSGNITVRGCKSSIYCDANDSTTCRSCFGSECNSIDLLNKHDDGYHGVWQQLPLKCHTCVGEHCLYSLGPSVTCSRRNINQDCMTVFDKRGLVERRGCSDDVEDYRDLYCRQHPERCFKCKSNECNIAWSTDEYVECLFCDSASNPLCVHNNTLSGVKSRQCYKNCMVALRADEIVRSCLDDKEMWIQHHCQQNNSIECAACSEHNCNGFVFPSDRLKCHICTDSSCSSSESQYCKFYDKNDFCFAKYENGSVNLLGCASSQNASTIAEWTVQKKLFKCEGNDCNELSNLPKAEVCISCDSSKTPDCAQQPLHVTTTENCTAPNSKCLTQVNDRGHTIRGCFSNLNSSEQSCESLDTCAVCNGEKCNNEVYPSNRRECHICNSIADNKCKKNPSSLKICPVYDVNDKCVSALDSDGFLKRSCASDIQCSINESAYCNICDTNGCNTVELTGSANVATNSIFLILLLPFTILFVSKY